MGAGKVYLVDLAHEITGYVDRASAMVESQANRLNSLADITVRDEAAITGSTPLTLREQMDLFVYDDSTRIFGGRIAILSPTVDGDAIVWRLQCQGFSVLLDQRLIQTAVPDTDISDAQIAQWIVSWGSDLGLTAADYVSTLQAVVDPASLGIAIGDTLRQALDKLASAVGGASYWIDEWKKLHWTAPSTAQGVDGGDFESNTSGWSLGTGATITTDAGPAGTGDTALVVLATTGTQRSAHENFNIVGNRRYFAAADLYTDSSGHGELAIDWLDVGNSIVREDVLTPPTLNAWGHVSALYTAPPSATHVSVIVRTSSGTAHTIKADNISVIGETAAYGASTTPNGTTTQAMETWTRSSDATKPINRVFVQGTGISGWRDQAASVAYFEQTFESYLQDDRVSTDAGISSRAAWVFSTNAFPRLSGGYKSVVPGLSPGTWQIVEQGNLGLTEINWIATIRTTFSGNGNMLYDITYGVPIQDTAGAMASIQAAFTGSTPVVGTSPSGPTGADATPPAVPTGLTLAFGAMLASDGTSSPYAIAAWTANADVDLEAYELQIDRDLVNAGSLAWTNPTTFRTQAISFFLENTLGGILYGARVRAVDTSGNYSAWSVVTSAISTADPYAPAIPPAPSAVAGYRTLGVTWPQNIEVDFDHYEVGYSTDNATWTVVQSKGAFTVITGLNAVLYYLRVRAVDRSGQVQTSSGDSTPVLASYDLAAGWSANGTATPTLVGAADLALNSAVITFLQTFKADISILNAGILKVGGLNQPSALEIYDSLGHLLGQWDGSGLIVTDPVVPLSKVKLASGVLSFSADGGATWTTALSGDGLAADSIKLGTAPGGHNAIPNSSMELAAFSTALSKLWTIAADWGAALATGQVNVTLTGTELNLTVTT